MRAVSKVLFLLVLALAHAMPQLGKPDDSRATSENSVQKLARPSPNDQDQAQNNGRQAGNFRGPIMRPPGPMLDPQVRMAMAMQAAQLEQMRRQAAQSQSGQQGVQTPPSNGNGQQGINSRPLDSQQPFGNGNRMPPMVPPMARMQPSFGNGPRPGFGVPSMTPSIAPPISGKNISDGHVSVGPSLEMTIVQQQQMMMNELARRQGINGNFPPQGMPQNEMERFMMSQDPRRELFERQMMSQGPSREQFERLAMMQQQAMMGQQTASGFPVNGDGSQTNTNTVAPSSPTTTDFPVPMNPNGMPPQRFDPRLAMQMQMAMTSQNVNPRLAMQMMAMQRMQSMSPDAASAQASSSPLSQGNMSPDRESVSGFLQRVRGNAMMQDPSIQGPMMAAPRMQQMPMVPGFATSGQVPDPGMQSMPMMRDPRQQQFAMMQGPVAPGPVMQGPMMQDPRIQQLVKMQNSAMSGQMIQDSMPSKATSVSDSASQNPSLTPVSGQDMTSISLPSIQHIMELEARLHEARENILRSFYTDLLKYRDFSQQVQAHLNAKLALLYQIEAQLATPLRSVLASQTTTPRLNLPIVAPNAQPSMTITKLRDIGMNGGRMDPTPSNEE